MTIRVRPVDRGRSSRDPNRRTFYVNLAFAITVIVAILILVAVGVTTWYSSHLAPAATVGGVTITKDQFFERASVEAFRIQQLAARVKADIDAGRLTAAQGDSRIQALNEALDDSQRAFSTTIVEKLIDTALQATFATELGVTITPEQIDQRIVEDKTRKEQRHTFLISVAPEVATGATAPTDAAKTAARKKIDEAVAAIKGGKTFEEVAKTFSGDASSASGGDLGWIDTTAAEDPAWEDAVFKLEINAMTDVILGADGTFRVGKITEIVPAQIDADVGPEAGGQQDQPGGVSRGGRQRGDADRRSATSSSPTRARPPPSARSRSCSSRHPTRRRARAPSRFATSSTRPRATRRAPPTSRRAIRPGRRPS